MPLPSATGHLHQEMQAQPASALSEERAALEAQLKLLDEAVAAAAAEEEEAGRAVEEALAQLQQAQQAAEQSAAESAAELEAVAAEAEAEAAAEVAGREAIFAAAAVSAAPVKSPSLPPVTINSPVHLLDAKLQELGARDPALGKLVELNRGVAGTWSRSPQTQESKEQQGQLREEAESEPEPTPESEPEQETELGPEPELEAETAPEPKETDGCTTIKTIEEDAVARLVWCQVGLQEVAGDKASRATTVGALAALFAAVTIGAVLIHNLPGKMYNATHAAGVAVVDSFAGDGE